MINFYKQVPTIYSAASRDFQYLSWLINIVLNSVKHNVDDMYDLPNSKADPRLAELLAFTLGFKIRRHYEQGQLVALVSILPSILKCKGSIKAVKLAANALVKAAGVIGTFEVTVEDCQINITLPESLIDVTLFIDVLPYILPAGMTCKITKKTIVLEPRLTEVNYADKLIHEWSHDVTVDDNTSKITGLSTLFDPTTSKTNTPMFTNFNNVNENDGDEPESEPELNLGLFNNNIIPVLEDPLLDYTNIKTESEEN